MFQCIEHMSGDALGNLCEPLCILEDVQAVACQHTTNNKHSAFTATLNSKKLVFKSPKKVNVFEPDLLYWLDEKNDRHYPSTEEFRNMIKELVLLKVNISISDEKADELGKLPKDDDSSSINQNDISRRATEMDNAWLLIQDYEYLLTILFTDNGLFPKRVGTCGSFYAVEHAEPLKGASALFSLEESKEEWERRSRLAVLILELLEKLDKAQLKFCDVELSNFGASGGKLRYLDLKGIRSKGIPCAAGEEGETDNLQLVCEKVYLGWVLRARVMLPGLLVSRRAPTVLSSLLRRCADPNASPPSAELRRALYNTMVKRV